MFWKRKREQKPQCKHEWHHLKDDYIYNNLGNCVDADDACWILCVKCEKEELVYRESWERIKRKQAILKEHNDKK